MRTVRVSPGYVNTVRVSPGIYRNSESFAGGKNSITPGYVRTVRVSPGVCIRASPGGI